MTDDFGGGDARIDIPTPPSVSARGVFRNDAPSDAEPSARVRFMSGDIDVPQDIYREVGIEPDFWALPTRADFLASRGRLSAASR